MESQILADYIIKLLGVVLSWPVAIVILGYWFRLPIADLIKRVRRAKGLGGELELDQQQVTSLEVVNKPLEANTATGTVSTSTGTISATGTFSGTAPTPSTLPTLAPHAAALVERIRNDPVFASKHGAEREEMLVRAIADKAVAVAFERIYRAIFGSQIDAMIMANAPGGATEERLVALFELAKQNNPNIHHDRTFEQWIAYPVAELMIEVTTTPDGKRLYVTTPQGRDFMHYFVSQGFGHKLG